MTDKKKNGWIKFVPSLDLPKERVSIAYDTHDERGIRYAYGYFQFYNGTCGCFWKDGNEQPKVVKAEDIKYWMPVPSLDVQEELVSEVLKEAANNAVIALVPSFGQKYSDGSYVSSCRDSFKREELLELFKAGAKWQKQQMMAKSANIEVKEDAGGYPYIPQMELYDYDKDIPFAKEGDKYKVIIIKED